MDLENQKRVKDFADQYGPENVVVLLGAAEGEGAGLAAETVTNGDPTFAGPLTGVQLGLTVYHICEPEIKAEVDPAVYDEQVGMMEMVLDVDDIVSEMSAIRNDYCKYLFSLFCKMGNYLFCCPGRQNAWQNEQEKVCRCVEKAEFLKSP